MKHDQKLYIIKKYVFAKDAKDAIAKDKRHPVDDVWMDEDYRKQTLSQTNPIEGFNKK